MARNAVAVLVLMMAVPLSAQSSPPTAPAPAKSLPPCSAPQYRQFDFWVGKWDVRPNGKQTIIAHSLIESLYGGCAIRENWMPLGGGGGGSLSNFDSGTGQWRQAWVDSSGTRVDFTGDYVGDAMAITGNWRGINGPGKDALVRMTYTRQPGGAVRQLGELSTDGGKSWGPSFDFIYSPSVDRGK